MQQPADLVLEGGGVKGIGLVGAVTALAGAGYQFPRVAGSSAGAIVASLVAGLQHAGEPLSRLEDVMRAVDYRRFRDSAGLGRVPVVGAALSLLATDGMYEGAYLEDFLTGALGDLGVRTFGDLRLPPDHPAAQAVRPEHVYALVVTASDLSRRRLARLPWDLPSYGADPDEQPVARAVRASAAIPFFFRPVRQPTPQGEATWVDGGLLSNFPVELFDREDGLEPRWPTFGVRLTTRPATPPTTSAVHGPLSLGLAALDTLLTDQGSSYLDDPCTVRRTVFVPTSGVSVVDFDIDRPTQDRLFDSGRGAAAAFLRDWSVVDYVRACRGAAPSGRVAVVGAALVRTADDGVARVLASRRTDPPLLAGHWEFAGGKVDPGESDEQALRRELREELQVEAVVGQRIGPDLDIGTTAVLRVYLAELRDGVEPALVDHDEHRWLAADELDDVAWLPVDRPVVDLLRELLA